MAVALIVAAILAGLGLLAGIAPSAAEPNNEFVACGPALFGRPDPLPDPACADAYAPFDTEAIVLLALFAAALVFLVLLVASAGRSARLARRRRLAAGGCPSGPPDPAADPGPRLTR
ncbi:hypothetical protein [Nakamurella sp.]|uniref:hypothetical protein n=1 Tax=Nakamurella sp. TaxID=1869182 RepID=UPI003784CC6F